MTLALLALLVGVALTLWVTTTLATAYILYRYVLLPWRVVRKDLTELAGRLAGMESRAKVSMMDDAEVARVEARLQARQRARVQQEGGLR